MKALILALCLIAGNAWGAIAANTTGLYDLEGNLTDSSGLGNNGTLSSTIFYTATNPWHGSQSGGGGGIFTIPNSVVGASGCVEFSFIAPDIGTTKVMFSIATAGGSRTLEIYHSTTNLYAFSNSVGVNTVIKSGLSAASKVYVKTTWNGTTWKVYGGDWTTAGTVTLAEIGSFTSPNTSTPTTISVCGSVPISNAFGGYLDWVRVRNVYDPTTTVTVDSSTATPSLQSPYLRNILTPRLRPNVTSIFNMLFMPSKASAMVADQESQRLWNDWVNKMDILKKKNPQIIPSVTPTPKPGQYSPTPTVTPTRTPAV